MLMCCSLPQAYGQTTTYTSAPASSAPPQTSYGGHVPSSSSSPYPPASSAASQPPPSAYAPTGAPASSYPPSRQSSFTAGNTGLLSDTALLHLVILHLSSLSTLFFLLRHSVYAHAIQAPASLRIRPPLRAKAPRTPPRHRTAAPPPPPRPRTRPPPLTVFLPYPLPLVPLLRPMARRLPRLRRPLHLPTAAAVPCPRDSTQRVQLPLHTATAWPRDRRTRSPRPPALLPRRLFPPLLPTPDLHREATLRLPLLRLQATLSLPLPA